jgi:hypothetical protein
MRKLVSLLAALVLCTVFAYAQLKTISGTVTDDNGNPIPFATVRLKNSRAAATADAEGKFILKANPGDVLVISAQGSVVKEVPVSAENVYLVSLPKSSTSTMQEVIVTAQGILRRPRELGYSVGKVKNEDLTLGHSPQLAQSLSGKVSGLAIYNADNSLGSD